MKRFNRFRQTTPGVPDWMNRATLVVVYLFLTGLGLLLSSDEAQAQNCSFGGTTIACFEINNDQAVTRNAEVAYSSIPLPRSVALLSTDNLQVTDDSGTPVAAQFRIIARWGGTVDTTTLPVRWLEVAVQDTITASSRAGYSLLNLAAPPPAVVNPLTVTELNGIYTVDTGVATFVIDSANPALLDEVSINATTLYQDVATAGPVLSLAGGATVLDRSLPGAVVVDPGTFALVDSGPLKAIFAINAHFVDAANARTLCADFEPGVASYESMGYTLILTLTRGTGDLDLQVNFRNECLDARFQPFTQGAETIDRLAWNLPLDLPNAANPLYAANGMMQNTNQTVVLEQGHGGGTPWLRQATVSLGGVVTANSEILADPVVALADNQFSVLAQMPWMRFREPQALEAGNDRIVLDLISEPTVVGGGKGLFYLARVSFLDGLTTAAQLEPVRVANRLALERGLMPRATLPDVNRSGVFPGLGTEAPSLLKSEYVSFITQWHNETVGPGGQHEQAKTFGSQLWPDTQGANWPNANNPVGPTDNPGGLNYWSTSRVELLEYFRTGDPLWAWELGLPLTWQQVFSAYVNLGENVDNFKNGLNLTSPVCNGPGGFCEQGQWYRYGGGSDDYGYTWGNLGYVLRPNHALMRRFAVAGNTVLNRYNIPRAMQAQREETVNQVDLQRQVIQHFVQLANCAEFVPGAEGLACHNRLIEVVTELAEENMSSGLMCQADIQPADPSRCMPVGGDPTLDWCDCVTPQQFINNSLISPFLHRMLLNYGDLGGSLAFGLSMNAWHQYRSTIGIPDAQRPTDPTDPARPAIDAATDWLSQPGWDQDVMPFEVQDVSVIDDDPFTTDPGTIIDENLILDPNKPHSAVQFLLAHSINPALNLCDVASTALDEQFMLDAWDDYQNLGGWLKGPAEIMQGMAFGIGIFDTCNLGVGNTPVVTITAPANGTIITVGTPLTLMAMANDVEDGDISAAINWSSNLDGNLGMGASIMATLGVGQHTLTAAVTDSDNRTGVASVMVTVNPVGGNAPVVVITSPVNGSMVDEGVAVTLAASAMDLEDGDLTAAIVWSSSLDGNLGTGGNLMRVLSVGQHTLTASVTDSSMLTSTDNVSVTVNMSGGCSAGLVMDEDFENGLGGWTSSGLWHRVTNSACGAPGFASPVSSVYFGQDADCDFDTGAREMGELISPVVNGIDASSVLRFSEFREVEFEPAATVDQTEVAVRAVGSMNWTPLLNRNSQDASNATWEQLADLPLAAFAGQPIQIRFLFDSDDEQFNQFTGWMIDDVQVTGCVSSNQLFSDGFED